MKVIDFINKIEIIAKRFAGYVEEKENCISICIGDNEFSDEIDNISDILVNLDLMNKNNVALFNDNLYEIALNRRTDIVRFFDKGAMNQIEDCENNIKYIIGEASFEYIFYLLESLDEKEIKRLRPGISHRANVLYDIENNTDNKINSLMDFIRDYFKSIITIKIKSNDNKTEGQFEQLFDSFRFQVANNQNDVIMPLDDFKELCFGMAMAGRRVNKSLKDFTAPKRIYINELTKQYYMGVSSRLPFVEFICYYHVMEYFYEKVYNDDMIKSLQDKISSPRFSIKREQDIKEIIKFVTKKVHDKNERYDINEMEALELVLKKYVDTSEIQNALSEKIIEYYRTTEVPFSKGDIIDLNDISNTKVYRKLAARIYKTRNSIIHSKSGDKAVYSPFTDDEALEKEIPLLRFIAEEIIIKTSKLM